MGDKRLQGKIAIQCSLYVENGRNELALNFLASKGEWLWIVDTDVAFPPDTLGKLLDATHGGDRKIVAAAYWTLGPKGTPVTSWLDEEFKHHYSMPGSGLVELGACGLGCTLIHRQVLDDIAELPRDPMDPWVWFGRDESEVGGLQRCGEDVSFCIRARRAGHKTWGLCSLVVDHYKTVVVPGPEPGVPPQQPEEREKPLTQEYRQAPSGLVLPV